MSSQATATCPNGHVNLFGQTFCGLCGAQIVATAPATPSPGTQVPPAPNLDVPPVPFARPSATPQPDPKTGRPDGSATSDEEEKGTLQRAAGWVWRDFRTWPLPVQALCWLAGWPVLIPILIVYRVPTSWWKRALAWAAKVLGWAGNTFSALVRRKRKLLVGVGVAFAALAILGGVLSALGLVPKEEVAGPKGKQSLAPMSVQSTPTHTPVPTPSVQPTVPPQPAYGPLAFQTVNDEGYTIGLVNADGIVVGFTPKGDLPYYCAVEAVAVATFPDSATSWEATSEKPTNAYGSEPKSTMAHFYGPFANGAYQFRADMELAPEFRTSDYTSDYFTKGLVLHVDCA
jgi:hypothetical protein